MGRPKKRTAEQIKKAIKGSGGVKSKIAANLEVDRHTFDSYLATMPTVAQAYEDECERVLDLAESVVVRNIQLAAVLQQDTGMPVDTGDAKWLLSRKGKQRGYSDRTEVTGADGGALTTLIQIVRDDGGAQPK